LRLVFCVQIIRQTWNFDYVIGHMRLSGWLNIVPKLVET